jgi:hypothetical protein
MSHTKHWSLIALSQPPEEAQVFNRSVFFHHEAGELCPGLQISGGVAPMASQRNTPTAESDNYA